jgi:hypothetical protein
VLRDPTEIAEGDTVYLYPQTKQASTNCHRQLTVQVGKKPEAHWPMVMCVWREHGTDFWEMVHRDNIRKKPASTTSASAEKRAGDSVGGTAGEGGGMAKWAKQGVLPGKPQPEIEGQGALF